MADKPKIRTSYDFPPIPMRQFDWSAWDDNLGADCSPVGRGPRKRKLLRILWSGWRKRMTNKLKEVSPLMRSHINLLVVQRRQWDGLAMWQTDITQRLACAALYYMAEEFLMNREATDANR